MPRAERGNIGGVCWTREVLPFDGAGRHRTDWPEATRRSSNGYLSRAGRTCHTIWGFERFLRREIRRPSALEVLAERCLIP